MNLSEHLASLESTWQNKAIPLGNPKKPLWLVHAAKNDTATMVLQEEELYKFMTNMTTSTGKGPSDAIHKAQWRVEQLNVAKDFIEIFDDIEVVMLEDQKANQPSSYQPK